MGCPMFRGGHRRHPEEARRLAVSMPLYVEEAGERLRRRENGEERIQKKDGTVCRREELFLFLFSRQASGVM